MVARFRLQRPAPGTVLGVIALVVACSGVAVAAIPDSAGVVSTCFTKSGSWRLIDTASTQCKAGETPLDFYGKAGANAAFLGKTGKAADADKLDGQDSSAFLGASAKAADSDTLDGQDSSAFLAASAKAADSDLLDGKNSTAFVERRWAVIRADGTVARDSGGVFAQQTIAGITFVNMAGQDITGCAYSATLGDDDNRDTGADDAPGFVTTRYGTNQEVVVVTYNSAGVLTRRGFHLTVTC